MVKRENACALPGVDIKYDNFMTCMRRAVHRGYVQECHAEFCAEGLRNGFTCGIDASQLRGHRFFNNYPTAVENRTAVTAAIMKRVDAGKTLVLGAWNGAARSQLRAEYTDCIKFSVGAVPKALEAGVYRPYSDHTKSGLNESTCMDTLRHSLTAYRDVAEYLKRGYFMRVSDVDNAFPMLPIHPDLWRFFLFSFWANDTDTHETLFMHLTGDFGTRGMPGTFKIFFVDVVCQMARSEMVLTLPMAIYVDDIGLVGPERDATDKEMVAFHEWAEETCGVHFKAIKDKWAAQHQLMIGFWWDSNTLTRTLEERKLTAYIAELTEFAGRASLTLAELQSIGGKAQRAIMTMPPGAACLCANMFAMTHGLKLPWQRRRTTSAVRQDFGHLAGLLEANLGKGYYSYSLFDTAPAVWSDASKSKAYTGGGFVSECGRYSYWPYGSSAARKPIDFLEGDTALHTAELMGDSWRKCVVPFGIDNTAFKGAADKGWSSAVRLQELVTKLFHMQIAGEYILQFFWLASADNDLADHLSRNREGEFLRAAAGTIGATLTRLADAGQVRQLGTGYSSNSLRDGPATGSIVLQSSVVYRRADLYTGLPEDMRDRLDEVRDNRLRPSSMRTVNAALGWWRKVCAKYEWPLVIPTEHDERGGRLAAFVLYLTDQTELVYASIDSYVWGLVNWMKLQRQADPRLGVEGWVDFMQSVKVLTWVPHEPRKEIPLAYIAEALASVVRTSIWEVQTAFWTVVNLFSFARTESSCPKNYTGEESFDKDYHWQNKDVRGARVEGKLCLKLNMKANKVDPRVERPEAAGGDWVYIGDVEGSVFSVIAWFTLLNQLRGDAGSDDAPFFRDRDGVRAYRYRDAVDDMRTLLGRVKVETGLLDASVYGGHGLRVAGYNLAKKGVGVDLTVAHGGWKSAAHDRYERFKMNAILDIPARMVGALPEAEVAEEMAARSDQPAQPEVRAIERRARLTRGDTSEPAAEGVGGSPETPTVQVRQPRPRGRAPHGTFGNPMTWDRVEGRWRESLTEGEDDDDDDDAAEQDAFGTAETPPPLPPALPARSPRLQLNQQGGSLPVTIFGQDPQRLARQLAASASAAPSSPSPPPIDRS